MPESLLFVDRAGRAFGSRPDFPRETARPSPESGRFVGAWPFAGSPAADSFVRPAVLVDVAHAGDTATHADGRGGASLPTLAGSLERDDDRRAWSSLVTRTLEWIDAGRARKIVLARSARLHAASPVDTQALAHSLLRAQGMYRYLVQRDGVLFAGASPELLVSRCGDTVRTEAVAGTAAVTDDAPGDAHGPPLCERDKDRREHAEVVHAIDDALAPLTLALERPDEPVERRHGRVTHLVTPFEGRVEPSTHVLDLAAALHPTPAVAGTPRDVALEFIAANEATPRGLYAGPIGWFDENGDGELAVALRCVRIEGQAVDLYAGAGIVSGSDADAEFDETTLKMRSTLASLGFDSAP